MSPLWGKCGDFRVMKTSFQDLISTASILAYNRAVV
jgi:hypothetical protein